MSEPLTVVYYRENRQFRVENTSRVESEGDKPDSVSWDDFYVSFGGFAGPHNPNVFAAAPDLLDALNGLSEWVSLHSRYPDMCEPLKAARAAIAKATQP